MATPLISIIVPVYMAEKYLDKCVQSLVDQTYENLEILLVDDGSPDRSGAMCDAWAEKDSRIRVLHKENGGTGTARNLAIECSKGELIGFVDNDDYISPDMYQLLYSMLDEKTDIAECGFIPTYDDSAEFPDCGEKPQWFPIQEAMRMHIHDGYFRQVIWNKLYRKELIQDARFPEGITMDDEFFTYKLLGRARGAAHCDKVCYAYRQQPESITHKPYSMKRLTGIRAKEERLEFLREKMPELVPAAEENLYFTCMYAMQMCMLAFAGEELKKAKDILWQALNKIPAPKPMKTKTWKENVWIILARISFEKTCALRNFLFER